MLLRVFITVCLLAALVVSLPAKSNAKQAVSARAKGKNAASNGGQTRRVSRAKRSVIVEVPEELIEEQEIEDELRQLSDKQLAMVAAMVQSELDQYDPEIPLTEYAIVDIPEEYLIEEEPMSRNRRGVPLETLEDVDEQMFLERNPELIVIPEEQYEEALMEEALEEAAEEAIAEEALKELDDQQLRSRISEMAAILNERASRSERRRR